MMIKSGSKYYPLFEHLHQCHPRPVCLTFTAIETLLGKPLPASARSRKNWWSNRESPSALQAGAWIGAQYQVTTVDLAQQTVTFHPFEAPYTIQRQDDGQIIWQQGAIKALRKHMSLTQAKFAQTLGVRRQTVSEWENGVYDPDRSKLKFLALIAKQANFAATLTPASPVTPASPEKTSAPVSSVETQAIETTAADDAEGVV